MDNSDSSMKDTAVIELLVNQELHQRVIQEAVLNASMYVWIATANLKDMHIPMAGRYKPVLEVFDKMAGNGISFRIVHSALPSKPFRKTLDRFDRLITGGLELQICPRCHWKLVIVDGNFAYLGSANFTGAGLGAKSDKKRNLELGIVSQDKAFVKQLVKMFDTFWMGMYCRDCRFIDKCPDPIEQD